MVESFDSRDVAEEAAAAVFVAFDSIVRGGNAMKLNARNRHMLARNQLD